MNKLTHDELLEKISSFEVSRTDEQRNDIIAVAGQIGFSTPSRSCKCKSGWSDLVIRLRLWAKQHLTACHYSIQPGIVRKGPDGKNVYSLNITDETAEWLLENDEVAAKFITKISEKEIEKVKEEPVEATDSKEDLFIESTEPATVEPVAVAVEAPVKKKKSTKKTKKGVS